jgi:DNA-binding response OmpR family regulator
MKKILIIEDEILIAELERDYLESHGFQADIESSGDIGLKKALTEEFDLVILDLMLPKTDGFEICRQIRKDKNIPILMVSAKKEDIDKIRGLGLGADDYMTKPFSPSELVARVKAHLARYERLMGSRDGGIQEEIQIRGLHIDKPSRKVHVNQREVILTSKEYDLLVFFAQHPNRVFNKNELFERIWGIDSLGDLTTVTVHIRKLREKIELDPSNPQYVETIWGVGYRFKI